MANKLTFELRIEDAKEYVENGEIKKAISTLSKAIEKDPEKDVDKKIETWIGELEVELAKPEEIVEEEVIPETIVDPTDDVDDEEETEVEVVEVEEELEEEDSDKIDFQILKPMNIAGELHKHPDIVKLPVSYKDMAGGFLIAVEDIEKEVE